MGAQAACARLSRSRCGTRRRRPWSPARSSPEHPPACHGDVLYRLHDQPVDNDVETTDHDHSDNDTVDLPESAGTENEVAKAALTHQHLGGNQRAPAVAHAEPQ